MDAAGGTGADLLDLIVYGENLNNSNLVEIAHLYSNLSLSLGRLLNCALELSQGYGVPITRV
jgi:hypothetical protein